MKAIIAQFEEENPGIEVELLAIQFPDYLRQLTTLVGAGTPPDVAHMYIPWLAQFVDIGALEPLDTLVTDDMKADTLGLTAGQVGGAQYGLTSTAGALVLFVNRTVLSEAGLDPDSAPTTWAEFEAACNQVVTQLKDISCLAINTQKEPSVFAWWHPLLKAYGGDVFDENGNCILNNEAGVAFVKEMKAWQDRGWMATGYGGVQARQVFGQSKAAFLFDGPWMKGILRDVSGKGEAFDAEWYVAPPPVGPKATQPYSQLAAHFNTMFAQSQHKAEAWKLIEFLARPDVQLKYYDTFGETPASIKANADPDLASDPYISTFAEATKFVATLPLGPRWPAVSDFWMQGMQETWAGQDAATAMTTACQNISVVQPPPAQ